MNVFGIGLPELAVIAAIGLLVFGPKRLPELGKTLGRTLKGFQSASSEFEKELRTAITTAEPVAADQSIAVSASELVSADASGADASELIEQPLDGPAA
jgi:sec-independent protein translocase protein TatA